jgi:hypothetical protein
MDAELLHVGLGLDHHVEQVRDRRALVAADVRHPGLEQRLGDGEDAFAVEGLAGAEAKRFHFLAERHFHAGLLNRARHRRAPLRRRSAGRYGDELSRSGAAEPPPACRSACGLLSRRRGLVGTPEPRLAPVRR